MTSKDTLMQICDYSEAGVTIRGQYFPPGKQPGEDERKLYLAIEGKQNVTLYTLIDICLKKLYF